MMSASREVRSALDVVGRGYGGPDTRTVDAAYCSGLAITLVRMPSLRRVFRRWPGAVSAVERRTVPVCASVVME